MSKFKCLIQTSPGEAGAYLYPPQAIDITELHYKGRAEPELPPLT